MPISRRLIKCAAIALTTLATSAGAALAGGEVVYGNGVRQVGAAVPVPVPVPVPEVSTGWYVRIDAAYSQGDVSKYRSTDPNVDAIRADSYLENFPRYGLGFGYYFNKNLRGDITIDQRNDAESRGRGNREARLQTSPAARTRRSPCAIPTATVSPRRTRQASPTFMPTSRSMSGSRPTSAQVSVSSVIS